MLAHTIKQRKKKDCAWIDSSERMMLQVKAPKTFIPKITGAVECAKMALSPTLLSIYHTEKTGLSQELMDFLKTRGHGDTLIEQTQRILRETSLRVSAVLSLERYIQHYRFMRDRTRHYRCIRHRRNRKPILWQRRKLPPEMEKLYSFVRDVTPNQNIPQERPKLFDGLRNPQNR
jgi:hypothetical protein